MSARIVLVNQKRMAPMRTATITALASMALLCWASARNPQSGKLPAPDFDGVTAWINSRPLRLADLRGQVVLVHFWTFGCSNCIHDHDKYLAFHGKFARRGVTLVGIHTPETDGERSLENVKAKVKEIGYKHAIAVDNDQAMWRAWRNRLWPSMYLIDKQGYARYAWEGELAWQGAKGPEIMSQKIEELLQEPASPTRSQRD
jgi:thiol-disulfide isomerase/thioredoxin